MPAEQLAGACRVLDGVDSPHLVDGRHARAGLDGSVGERMADGDEPPRRDECLGDDIGDDHAGQRPGSLRNRRWVAYAGVVEASVVPPEWHAWLHYTTDAPLPDTGRKAWQKPHLANATGTPASYRPPGHDYEGGHRARATGDYEAWTPS